MYIFGINPLSVSSFDIIFSHSEGCLFTLLIVSFVVQKLLIFIRRWTKKDHDVVYVKSILPMISSKSFIVSNLTFRSLIHFEFIFVYGVRECSNLFLCMVLHVAVLFS